jgi:tetratricopeptide (TPR) repeat protein
MTPRGRHLAAAATLAGIWALGSVLLRRRLVWLGPYLLGRLSPDLSAEGWEDVVRSAAKYARRFPARASRPGAIESDARLLWERGHHAEAVAYLDLVLAFRRELGDRTGKAMAHTWLGAAHWYAGDLDEALRQYQLALPLSEETFEAADRAVLERSVGRLHADRGEPQAALEWLESSLSIFRDLGDLPEQETMREEIERVRREIQE